eukprot:GSChrysophyteH1.ASY1.ANO1.2110.1 assembled CDS
MSLFAHLSQGDIWAISGISFASPINDILEKEEFTLEELLCEEELLQEVKSQNSKLHAFLSSEEVVEKLIAYIIVPAEPDSDEARQFKYPYMACEVFACEVPDILQALIDNDCRLLKYFFTFLELDAPLDQYLAGYFEKIMEMLFRHTTVPLMEYLNNPENNVLKNFMKHMNNYSVMQLVQRLMLPHIPFGMNVEEVVIPEGSQCTWSFSPETCEMLCKQMLQGDGDTPSHISDLFITVMQLSPPDALIISHMSQDMDILKSLLEAAIVDDGDTATTADIPTARAAVSLASISVLEAIVSRMCETASSVLDIDEDIDGGIERFQEKTKTAMANIAVCLEPYLDKIAAQLKRYATDSPSGTIAGQAKFTYPRLGHRGLLLVKLVESLVRLHLGSLDEKLCSSGILSATIDLLFVFDMNSSLHLTIQRIVLMVIEGGNSRRNTQTHLFDECQLIKRVLNTLWSTRCPQEHESIRKERGFSSDCSVRAASPCIGHLVSISQAINHIIQSETFSADQKEAVENDPASSQGENESGNSSESENIKTVMKNASLYDDWEALTEHILKPLEGQHNIEVDDEITGDGSFTTQMELAMQALGLQSGGSGIENLDWGSQSNQSQLQNDENNKDHTSAERQVHELDDDDDDDSDDDEPPMRGITSANKPEEDAVDVFADDFADFDNAPDPDLVIAATNVPAAAAPAPIPTGTQEAEAFFADFDNTPDAELDDAFAENKDAPNATTSTSPTKADPFSQGGADDADPFATDNSSDVVTATVIAEIE